eukprot:3978155-Lingulodinium_polyedra.AAC.1
MPRPTPCSVPLCYGSLAQPFARCGSGGSCEMAPCQGTARAGARGVAVRQNNPWRQGAIC